MTSMTLPEHYRLIREIDLQKDRKLAFLINGLALVIAVALLIFGFLRRGSFVIHVSGTLLVRLLLWIAAVPAYMVLHELTHGLVMRMLSGARPRYGFTGLYAYAGSNAYFGRAEYIGIALAPVLLFGIVLAVLVRVLPSEWFWFVYSIQIINLSGAAGDLYVSFLMLFLLPADTLTRDRGVGMAFYTAKD